MCRACENALHTLHLVDRDYPLTEMVARKIIDFGETGGDPAGAMVRGTRVCTTRRLSQASPRGAAVPSATLAAEVERVIGQRPAEG